MIKWFKKLFESKEVKFERLVSEMYVDGEYTRHLERHKNDMDSGNIPIVPVGPPSRWVIETYPGSFRAKHINDASKEAYRRYLELFKRLTGI